MMLTRIKRGAVQSSLLCRYKLEKLAAKPMYQLNRLVRQAAAAVLILQVVAVPMPVEATLATVSDSSVTPEEPPLLVPPLLAGAYSLDLVFNAEVAPFASPVVALPVATLGQVQTGTSRADAEAAERRAREQAAREQAEAEARRRQQEEAERKKAALQVTLATAVRALSSTEYDELFQRYFASEWKIARAVCTAESGLVPNKVSRTRDYGVCQINQVHRGRVGGNLSALFDPETNIRVAAEIFQDNGGWRPWTVFRTGAYKKYLQ